MSAVGVYQLLPRRSCVWRLVYIVARARACVCVYLCLCTADNKREKCVSSTLRENNGE